MSTEEFTDDMDAIRQIFFDECDEQLALLEEELTTLGEELENGEKINTIFRCVHSIKGGAAAFGMEELVKFSHLFESVLDLFRSGTHSVTNDSVSTFLKCKDALFDIVAAFKNGGETVRSLLIRFLNLRVIFIPKHLSRNRRLKMPRWMIFSGWPLRRLKLKSMSD